MADKNGRNHTGATNGGRRKKPRSRVGIAIIISFLLVPVLFIVLYASSDRSHHLTGDALEAETYTGEAIASGENDVPGELPSAAEQYPQPSTDAGEYVGQDNGYTEEPEPQEPQDPEESRAPEVDGVDVVGVVYLTFDDGPMRAITTGVLDILREEDIRATFFVVPFQGLDDLYLRIIDEGHEIGNHSYSHVYSALYERGANVFRDDVIRAREFINDNFDYTTTSFRFPGGSMSWGRDVINPRRDVLNDLGYRHFDWHVDPSDWRSGTTAAEITKEVLEQTIAQTALGREHIIILLHDRYQRTLDALPGIITSLREKGYAFDIVRNFPD